MGIKQDSANEPRCPAGGGDMMLTAVSIHSLTHNGDYIKPIDFTVFYV